MDTSKIKLFSTHEHPCSYLDDMAATTVFVDPTLELNKRVYSELSDFGFRRSGRHLYRPNCRQCQSCVPVRIPVNDFKANRTQKRCVKKNSDITTSLVASIDTDEHYSLYANYINARHSDGDMHPPSRQQYNEFLSSEWGATTYIEFRADGSLIAIAVSDQLDQGLSAIYTFYDPRQVQRSLGVYAVLAQIERCRTMNLPYLYLGYWIRECHKMNYKTQYQPLQMFLNNRWINFRTRPKP